MRRWETPGVLGLLGVAALLRMAELDTMAFADDQVWGLELGQEILDARPWATGAPWPVLGMVSSAGIHNGPLFSYLQAILLALAADPVTQVRIIGVLHLAALIALHRWVRRFGGAQPAMLALATAVASPFDVLYSRLLWNVSLLFPALMLMVWGGTWLVERRSWRGLWLALLGSVLVSQLHLAGPLVVLAASVFTARALAKSPRPWGRIPALDLGALLAVVALGVVMWVPYLEYLASHPLQAWGSKSRSSLLEPDLAIKLFAHVVPFDIHWFFKPVIPRFYTEMQAGTASLVARVAGLVLAVATGLPLAAWGLFRWATARAQFPVWREAWLTVLAAFVVARVVSVPHYVVLLYPLPFLVVSGALDPPGMSPGWARLLGVLRAGHAASLALLTAGLVSWLGSRGGASGNYNVSFRVRAVQASEIAHRLPSLLPPPAAGPSSACGPLPPAVDWLLRHQGQRAVEPERLILCESWREDEGGERLVWTVHRQPPEAGGR